MLEFVLSVAEARAAEGKTSKKDEVSEKECEGIRAAMGMVWETYDPLLKMGKKGVGGGVVKRAEEWRGTYLDAVKEIKD